MRAVAIWSVLMLSACVVHSKTPLFSEAEAVALLGTRPVTVTVTATDPAQPFNAIPARLDLLPEGNHYRVIAPGPKGPTDLAFVPMGRDLYALQYGVGAGQDYALAVWDGVRLAVAPLDCGRLKTDLRTNLLLIFVTSSCRLVPGTDPRAAFASFAETGPPVGLTMQVQ